MSFAITQNCCKDASCVAACPVNCIHPAPGEPEFATATMLYIDPRVCIDCGACADACPVDAAVPADVLRGPERAYVEINQRYFAGRPILPRRTPLFHAWDRPRFDWTIPADFAALDVAVVGTGPAGLYAAEMLLLHTNSNVTLIDRLPVAGGLVRYGVAPDHPGTKRVAGSFARLYNDPRVRVLLGVEVGTTVSTAELTSNFDAVIYAVGASAGRHLGVPGEDLPGVTTAPDFVGWYNGHPDIPDSTVALPVLGRAVVVGTGNVALDVARILVAPTGELGTTDIADHALAQLRSAAVRDVTVLGRRGPGHAAFTEPELLALRHLPGVEVVVDRSDPRTAAALDAASAGHARLVRDLPSAPATPDSRTITLRFHAVVDRICGGTRVEGVELADGTTLPADLVVTSIGYRRSAFPGLPFEASTETVPNEAGRVDGVPGAYAVGWFKRGASGGIGHNRADAEETVHTLIHDAIAGRLAGKTGSPRAFRRLVRGRHPGLVEGKGLARILAREQAAGVASSRPAVKFTTHAELLAAARG